MSPKHLATTMAHLGAASGITMSAGAAAAPIVVGAGTAGMPYDAALAGARKAGAEAERIRIGAILNHEAAAGRGRLAAHLAFKTDMAVDAAGEMLAASATDGAPYAAATGAAGAAAETIDWGSIVAGINATLPNAQIEKDTR